jgi:hypothetical protein
LIDRSLPDEGRTAISIIRALREALGRDEVSSRVWRVRPKIDANMAPTVFSCRQIERNVD